MTTESVSSDVLAGCAHLSELSSDVLSKLAAIAEPFAIANGETLFSDMDPADRFFLLVRGEISICCEMGSGEMRPMDSVKAGELFAWSALVEPYRCTSNAIAKTDCELVVFDAAKLREMCHEDMDLGYLVLHKVIHLLAHRLKSVRGQLAAS